MSHAIALAGVLAVAAVILVLFRRKRAGSGPVDAPVDHGPETK